MQYKKILHPTDGSPVAKKALTHAISIARQYDSTIYILVVFQQNIGLNVNFNSSLPPEIYQQYQDSNKKSATDIANQIVTELFSLNISAEKIVFQGNPKSIISEYAQSNKMDLIVMGTRGLSDLNYMGSTSSYVINNTKGVPVMVVD